MSACVLLKSPNCLTLLRYSETVTHHSLFAVSLGLPFSHSCVGADEGRFREGYTGRHPVIPAKPSPGGHECSRSTGVPVQSTRPHHTAASASALAACAEANSVLKHAVLVYQGLSQLAPAYVV